MGIITRLALKIVLNAAALYAAGLYLKGFFVTSDPTELLIAALIISLVHLVLRPVLKLVSFPLVLITFGLFNIVINLALLWFADSLTASIAIEGWRTLLIASFAFGIINSLF